MEDTSKKTKKVPSAITERIRRLQAELERETVKVQGMIHGLCEALILAEGVSVGKWELTADYTEIVMKGDSTNG